MRHRKLYSAKLYSTAISAIPEQDGQHNPVKSKALVVVASKMVNIPKYVFTSMPQEYIADTES